MEAITHYVNVRDELTITLRSVDKLNSTQIIVLRPIEKLNVTGAFYSLAGTTLATTINQFIEAGVFNEVTWERLLVTWEHFLDRAKTWQEILLFYKLSEVETI